MVNGIWKGTVANKLMDSINGGVIHGDSQHFGHMALTRKRKLLIWGRRQFRPGRWPMP
jgi:hypothetical protein